MGFLVLSLLVLSQVSAYPSSYERKYQCQVPQAGQVIMRSPASSGGNARIALKQGGLEVYEYTPGETYTLEINYPEPARGFTMTSSGTFYGASATHRLGCGNQRITSDTRVWAYSSSWTAPESTQATITVAYASSYGTVYLNTATVPKAAPPAAEQGTSTTGNFEVNYLETGSVQTIVRGDGSNYPQQGDNIAIHYTAKLKATNSIFDSSKNTGQPLEFKLGVGKVIRGMDEGIARMSLGETAEIVIQSEFGYGSQQVGPIPPNSDLIFEVELISINGQEATSVDTSESSCVDDMPECPQYKDYCSFVGPFCSATCGLCETVAAAPPCVDVPTVQGSNNVQYTCGQLISLCTDSEYSAIVRDQCPVTCGVCPGGGASAAISVAEDVTTDVYLGHGCFWETQYHFINLELSNSLRPCLGQYGDARCKSTGSFDRDVAGVTSLSGYAGGNYPGTTACYSGNFNHGPMGHTEVVAVTLDGSPSSVTAQEQFSKLIDLYFEGFVRTPMGMQRPDPMDKGRRYRSAIGIPGGVNSPLYPLVVAANKYGMSLIPGDGSENDVINVAYVHDSNLFPFFPAEAYHQYHSDFKGTPFPKSYVNTMYQEKLNLGDLPDTPQCAPGQHW